MKTKFIITIFFLVLIAKGNTNAQNLNISLSGGYNIVNIHVIPMFPSANGQPYGYMKSFNFNCDISYRSKGIFGFSIEPGYIQKGASIYKSKLELNDIQLPLLANVYFFNVFCLSIGPEFSYLVSAKCVNPSFTDDITSSYNRFEFSGIIGISCFFTKNVGIRLAYNHGLTNIGQLPLYGDQWEILRQLNLYNQYFQVQLSIRIHSIDFKRNNFD